jgi:hypothetical protein
LLCDRIGQISLKPDLRILKMLDIKGSFFVIKLFALHADVKYLLIFLKDRVLFVKSGFADSFTQGLSLSKYLSIIGVFFAVFLVLGLIFYFLKSFIKINSDISVLIVVLVSIVVAVIYERRIRKKQGISPITLDSIRTKSIQEILNMNKDNHELFYGDILKIEITDSNSGFRAPRIGQLTIIYRNGKDNLNMPNDQNYEECKAIVQQFLPDKLIEKRAKR